MEQNLGKKVSICASINPLAKIWKMFILHIIYFLQDMQERADAAEAAVMKGGAKAIQKAEARLKTLQTNLEGETRRATEASKSLARADRRVRELEFQVVLDFSFTTAKQKVSNANFFSGG